MKSAMGCFLTFAEFSPLIKLHNQRYISHDGVDSPSSLHFWTMIVATCALVPVMDSRAGAKQADQGTKTKDIIYIYN